MTEGQTPGRQWPSNCLPLLSLTLPPAPSILPMRCPFSLSLCLCKAGQVFVTVVQSKGGAASKIQSEAGRVPGHDPILQPKKA